MTSTPRKTYPDLDWSEVDDRAVDTVRVLAMDAVQKVGNGHPGTAMSLAPAAYLIFQKLMRHNPADPDWPGRDRFVLSCGHSSLTLYIQLYLAGLRPRARRPGGAARLGQPDPRAPRARPHRRRRDDHRPARPGRRQRRRHGDGGPARARPLRSRTARRARACSTTTSSSSPATATSRRASAPRRPRSPATSSSATWCCSTTTTRSRSRTTPTSRSARTSPSATRRTAGTSRTVDWTNGGKGYKEDVQALFEAFQAAKAETGRPSFISLRTIIAWPAPKAQNTGKAHGSALGEDEVAATKKILGFDPDRTFEVDDEVIEHTRKAIERGKLLQVDVAGGLRRVGGQGGRPQGALRADAHAHPAGGLGRRTSDVRRRRQKGVATRVASGDILSAIAPVLPELWGGSADLAGSNNTTPKGEPSFIPPEHATKMFSGDWYGRVLHFGIREHAMGSILNGIALHGGTRPYGGTFLVFSDYMRPAVRLAALMKLPGHLRLDARLDRARRGRPDPPADRAPQRAAGHPGPRRRAPGRRQRDRRRLARHPRAPRPAGRPGADPAERSDVPARHRRLPRHLGRGSRWLRAARRRRRRARRRPHRHRFRGPDRGGGARAARRGRASGPGSCRCRAASGSTTRTRPTATR